MPSTLHSLTATALDRLGDLSNSIWSRAEIGLYLQDGYDEFCRRTRVLYDVVVIENVPITGNWQTSLERYFAEQRSGWGLTDRPFHFTGEHERNLGVGGKYGGSYSGPAPATSPSETPYFDADNVNSLSTNLPSNVPGGDLPQSTVEVLRVAYDNNTLTGLHSSQLRELYPNYETQSGEPQWFTFDKDGLFFVRVIPMAQGDATYNTISGSWGTMRVTDETGITTSTVEPEGHNTGGFGILRRRDGCFPSGGPWGTPRRRHPDAKNIKVEIYRLGKRLSSHPSELPLAWEKYVIFWAMSKAFEREGSGQNLELAQHFRERFEMGIQRAGKRKRELQAEYVTKLGRGKKEADWGGIGLAQPPYPYAEPF